MLLILLLPITKLNYNISFHPNNRTGRNEYFAPTFTTEQLAIKNTLVFSNSSINFLYKKKLSLTKRQ